MSKSKLIDLNSVDENLLKRFKLDKIGKIESFCLTAFRCTGERESIYRGRTPLEIVESSAPPLAEAFKLKLSSETRGSHQKPCMEGGQSSGDYYDECYKVEYFQLNK